MYWQNIYPHLFKYTKPPTCAHVIRSVAPQVNISAFQSQVSLYFHFLSPAIEDLPSSSEHHIYFSYSIKLYVNANI